MLLFLCLLCPIASMDSIPKEIWDIIIRFGLCGVPKVVEGSQFLRSLHLTCHSFHKILESNHAWEELLSLLGLEVGKKCAKDQIRHLTKLYKVQVMIPYNKEIICKQVFVRPYFTLRQVRRKIKEHLKQLKMNKIFFTTLFHPNRESGIIMPKIHTRLDAPLYSKTDLEIYGTIAVKMYFYGS
jgi:hypothetical protein